MTALLITLLALAALVVTFFAGAKHGAEVEAQTIAEALKFEAAAVTEYKAVVSKIRLTLNNGLARVSKYL